MAEAAMGSCVTCMLLLLSPCQTQTAAVENCLSVWIAGHKMQKTMLRTADKDTVARNLGKGKGERIGNGKGKRKRGKLTDQDQDEGEGEAKDADEDVDKDEDENEHENEHEDTGMAIEAGNQLLQNKQTMSRNANQERDQNERKAKRPTDG
ncbi:hypothetical protein ACLKA6_015371 [Drosophila palustris]